MLQVKEIESLVIQIQQTLVVIITEQLMMLMGMEMSMFVVQVLG